MNGAYHQKMYELFMSQVVGKFLHLPFHRHPGNPTKFLWSLEVNHSFLIVPKGAMAFCCCCCFRVILSPYFREVLKIFNSLYREYCFSCYTLFDVFHRVRLCYRLGSYFKHMLVYTFYCAIGYIHVVHLMIQLFSGCTSCC